MLRVVQDPGAEVGKPAVERRRGGEQEHVALERVEAKSLGKDRQGGGRVAGSGFDRFALVAGNLVAAARRVVVHGAGLSQEPPQPRQRGREMTAVAFLPSHHIVHPASASNLSSDLLPRSAHSDQDH